MENRPMISHPRLKPSCALERAPDTLSIRNGVFRLSIPVLPDAHVTPDRIRNEAGDPDAVESALLELTGADAESVRALVAELVRSGVLIQHERGERRWFDAEYIAHRLVDTYRTALPSALAATSLVDVLSAPAGEPVAVGLLLEIYYFVRAAGWTSGGVLGRPMKSGQRALLEEYFRRQHGHAEAMPPAFLCVGLHEDDVRRGVETVENQLYQNLFYAFGHRSAAHFATALIVPEVPQHPVACADGPDGSGTDLLCLVQQVHRIPGELAGILHAHSAAGSAGDHGTLPVRVIAAEEAIAHDTAADLFSALRLTQDSYIHFLDGVARRYRDWCGHPVSASAYPY